MKKELKATGVVKRYGKKEVLHGVDVCIEPGVIYGLIGRNGAGKTTLMGILTAQNTFDEGEVTYGGQPVWENRAALAELCFSREIPTTLLMGQNTSKVRDYLSAAAVYYPHWDKEYAQRLVDRFGLDRKKSVSKLSKGMLSMLTIVIALASRAPVTILDEPVAGLDVVAREDFYKLLLDDYAETNRTFIISTHIIEEAANVFERVLVLHDGKMLVDAPTDEFVQSFTLITGHEDEVAAVCSELGVSHAVHTERMGRQVQTAVRAPRPAVRAAGEGHDVDLEGINLQKAFVYLTQANGEGAAC